jgi:hypothetical protein
LEEPSLVKERKGSLGSPIASVGTIELLNCNVKRLYWKTIGNAAIAFWVEL